MAGTIYETEYQIYLENARTRLDHTDALLIEEYDEQQKFYDMIADIYDKSIEQQESEDHKILAEEVLKIFPDNKAIRILDYACGTGRVSDQLAIRGYNNLHGLDPNKSLLDLAIEKGHIKKIFQINSNESHEAIEKKSYDVVVSSGTFFLSPSHPGYETYPTLCNLIKKNGYIVIVTAKRYLEYSYVKHELFKEFLEKGMLKLVEKKFFPAYRKPFEHETDEQCFGIVLVYQVLS